MSKKKKNKKKNLLSILKDNKENITIKKGDKLISLADATKESVEGITACEQSSIISVSAAEAADKKENIGFSIETRFSRHVFSMYEEAMKSFFSMTPDGKTSMLQDVEAGRRTEVELFAGTIIGFGKRHGIPTPYNMVLKEMLEVVHENYKK